ncbi:hypothetical protein EDB84DRAFT_1677748 [Lactarius hengduanensis]|nr:hypothetical protein EDB84DRAFT_1677748 [Lactarius hengduanensis]
MTTSGHTTPGTPAQRHACIEAGYWSFVHGEKLVAEMTIGTVVAELLYTVIPTAPGPALATKGVPHRTKLSTLDTAAEEDVGLPRGTVNNETNGLSALTRFKLTVDTIGVLYELAHYFLSYPHAGEFNPPTAWVAPMLGNNGREPSRESLQCRSEHGRLMRWKRVLRDDQRMRVGYFESGSGGENAHFVFDSSGSIISTLGENPVPRAARGHHGTCAESVGLQNARRSGGDEKVTKCPHQQGHFQAALWLDLGRCPGKRHWGPFGAMSYYRRRGGSRVFLCLDVQGNELHPVMANYTQLFQEGLVPGAVGGTSPVKFVKSRPASSERITSESSLARMRRHAGHDLLVILWSCQSVFGPLRPVALYIFSGKVLGSDRPVHLPVQAAWTARKNESYGLCLATPPYCDSMIRVFKEGLSPQSWPSKPSTNSRRAKSSPQHPAFHCPILERLRMAVPQPQPDPFLIWGEIQVVRALDTEVTSLASQASLPAAVIDGFHHNRTRHGRGAAPSGGGTILRVPQCGRTMWAMVDEDGRDLVEHFYRALFSNPRREQRVPYYESARALRFAVKNLRRKRRITLERWVNFVHYGA